MKCEMVDLEEKFCEIVLIRHGETDWNNSGILQGREDIPMNKKGCQQIRSMAKTLKQLIEATPDAYDSTKLSVSIPHVANPLGVSAIYTSPLSRALKSAQLLAEEIHFPIEHIQVENAVMEWNAGILQGTPLRDIPRKFPEIWCKWKKNRDPEYRVPNGESFLERYTRVTEAIQRLASRHPGERIIIVCHAGVLDDVYRRAMHKPHHQDTGLPKLNAGVHILKVALEPLQHESLSTWKILRWGAKTKDEIYGLIDEDAILEQSEDPRRNISIIYA